MRSMIFSINQTFQRILVNIAQGGGGWSSAPPKFAWDQKSPLKSLQRPQGGGTSPVGNHGFRERLAWLAVRATMTYSAGQPT
jgi:hypothetical protein